MYNTSSEFNEMKQSLLKRKWQILIPSFLALVLSLLILPKLVEPLYESEVTLYPSPTVVGDHFETVEFRFGSDHDVRQFLELLRSTAVKDSVRKRFNLIEVYEIDKENEKWQARFNSMFRQRFTFNRTLTNACHIVVKDADPNRAAELANYIHRAADNHKAALFRENYRKAYQNLSNNYYRQLTYIENLRDSFENQRTANFSQHLTDLERNLQAKDALVNNLHDQIDQIRNAYGIYDLGEQINLLYEQIVKAEGAYFRDSGMVSRLENASTKQDSLLEVQQASLNGSRLQLQKLRKNLNELTSANTTYTRLLNRLDIEQEQLAVIQSEYEEKAGQYYGIASDFRFQNFRESYQNEFDILKQLRRRYVNAQNLYYQDFISSYVISPAEANPVPQRPRRLIMSTFIAGCVFLFTVLLSLRK